MDRQYLLARSTHIRDPRWRHLRAFCGRTERRYGTPFDNLDVVETLPARGKTCETCFRLDARYVETAERSGLDLGGEA